MLSCPSPEHQQPDVNAMNRPEHILSNAQTAAQAFCWKTEQPNHENEWMLSVYVSENHGYTLQLYISLG